MDVRCPSCRATEGRAVTVQTSGTVAVIVTYQCGACGHEWTAVRTDPGSPSVSRLTQTREDNSPAQR